MILSAKDLIVSDNDEHEMVFNVVGLSNKRGQQRQFKILRVIVPSIYAVNFVITGLWVEIEGEKEGEPEKCHILVGGGEVSAVVLSETCFPWTDFELDVESLKEGDKIVLKFKALDSTAYVNRRFSAAILGRTHF
jgi:hypothetical protein